MPTIFNSPSIKRRFMVSVAANVARAGLSLLVGLLVARGLGPVEYGNLAYLLGSFWAIQALLDMGTSNAFYTFISQKNNNKRYLKLYFSWLVAQFFIAMISLAILMPDWMLKRFWLGQSRDLVLLALVASFLQNQVWQTAVQINESKRKTARIQVFNLAIIASHLLFVALLQLCAQLSLVHVLLALCIEYSTAVLVLSCFLKKEKSREALPPVLEKDITFQDVWADYRDYCKPLVIIAVFSFFHDVVDRWLLQRYGGASQQGFYQIANQLSTISLLFVNSILNILWKELSEACGNKNAERIIYLYGKSTAILVFTAALFSCFLAPWAEQLVMVLLGPAFIPGWPVLFIMLLYPVHQVMGQINCTLFMATAQTKLYMRITIFGLLVSMPAAYLLIAPAQGGWLPGLGLAAEGLALKIVVLNVLLVNFQSWCISRHYHAKYNWRQQFVCMLFLLAFGYVAKYCSEFIFLILIKKYSVGSNIYLLGSVFVGGIFYLIFSLAFLWRFPAVSGLSREEMHSLFVKFKNAIVAVMAK